MTGDRAMTIGAGLDAVRTPRPIAPDEAIHVLGIAGAGASGAALLAAAAGASVSGCDPGGESPYSAALSASGVPVAATHDAQHVTAADPTPTRLAVTKALTAIDPDQAELRAARVAGIPVEPWQQVVADAAHGRTLVGVAGTHGKSTTAGWLVHVVAAAGHDPGAFVGALLPATISGGVPATSRFGAGSAFIVEADEYAGNFDAYRPAIAALTSIEWDHPDVFADRAAVIEAFRGWVTAMGQGWPSAGPAIPPGGRQPILVANVGDPGVAALVAALPRGLVETRPYVLLEGDDPAPSGASLSGRILESAPRFTRIEISGLPGVARSVIVALPTAGRHNAANALAVAGAASALGLDVASIAAGLESFPGVGRRLERKGEARSVAVYDDYGHHPTAIVETIRAVRQREPGRRVWAVYEPLTYHRTAALHEAFADALANADAVAVAQIWAGRDLDTSVDTAEALAASVANRRNGLTAVAPGDVEETAAWLSGEVRPGDVVLVMGGGRSYRIGELLLEALEGD